MHRLVKKSAKYRISFAKCVQPQDYETVSTLSAVQAIVYPAQQSRILRTTGQKMIDGRKRKLRNR